MAKTTSSPLQLFNNWPNDVGFDVMHEERDPIELKVSGNIPSYVSGTLYRTGPGGYHKIQSEKGTTFSLDHWFDGFAQNHHFQIIQQPGSTTPTRIIYNSWWSVDPLIKKVHKMGKMDRITFGQKRDPCIGFFRKLMSIFMPEPANTQNANVGITISVNPTGLKEIDTSNGKAKRGGHASGISSLWAKTDAALFRKLDPETLEPMGVIDQSTLHPELNSNMSGAHAKSDAVTGDIYNYNLAFGRSCTYHIFRVSASTGKTEIIATITDAPGAYIHSSLLTENYFVFCVWGAQYSWGGAKMLWEMNMLDAIAPFNLSKKALWYVIDRKHGKGVVARYESDPFFCFHTVNAWEQPSPSDPSQIDIVADLSMYKNLDILKRFYYDNLKSTSAGAYDYAGENRCEVFLRRWRLPWVNAPMQEEVGARKAIVVHTAKPDHSCDLPTFNTRFITKPTRYIYSLSDRGLSTFYDGLVKYDTLTDMPTHWSVDGHSPGEPIFITNPSGTEEDDEVLLSIVLDRQVEKSYLLVVDAKTMKEIRRASMKCVVGLGLHGAYHLGGVKGVGMDI